MFYRMIEAKRNTWLQSDACTVKDLIAYVEKAGQMRDAQIEAIKTYLFLKIACGTQPLATLFSRGVFNNLNLDEAELSARVRDYLKANPAAAALYEYATLRNDRGEQVSEKLEKQIKAAPESIDYRQFFRDAFYKLSYTDYLFSLPMGAGKTYLMAAFIYIDLYFAMNEPGNPAFAHNFIIFSPSGLKSSVVPSLKTIQNFDPSWVIPEPAASELKRIIIFEVLDQAKSSNKSNRTKNPNVQKIARHQPLSDLFGLVAVTNAEKVILDRLPDKDWQMGMFDNEVDPHELRNLIGKLPALSIYIDEVHHAVSDDIKLRAVVTRWSQSQRFNSVIGFSGTPYLEKAEKISVAEKLSIATAEITNIVYYYPLIDGIGNFLKRPRVKIAEVAESPIIIEKGVREFLNTYKDTVYHDGTVAKLGIYCGTIEKLEEMVYPLVFSIASEYGYGSDAILKFHKGNKRYLQPTDSQLQFDSLDKPFSRIRIVLLVQIGKEGWDCRSLTGIILSQEGDCPKNMVLQTSCRCLRQVDKNAPETALIYLNDTNAEKLNTQLQQAHHISLKEFAEADNPVITLNRYDRTAYLKLPKVDFYQLKVNYETLIIEEADPQRAIPKAADNTRVLAPVIKTTDFTMEVSGISVDNAEYGTVHATFPTWLHRIVKGSFGMIIPQELDAYRNALYKVYLSVTYERDGARYYSSKIDQAAVEANIRKAFSAKRTFNTTEEIIPAEASLLNIANFTPTIRTTQPDSYYPKQDMVERIVQDDAGKLKVSKDTQQMIDMARKLNNTEIPGLKNEDALDAFWEGAISDSRLGMVPVYVPNLMDSSSKLLDVVMMNRIIHQAIPELDSSVKKVIVYYIDITDETEIRQFIKDDDSTTVEIELRDLKAILDDVVIGDYATFHVEETHEDLLGGYAVTIDSFISDRVLRKIDEFNRTAALNTAAKKPYKPIEISEEGLELIEFLSLDCTAVEGEWHSDAEIKIDKNGYVILNGTKTKQFWDGKIRTDRPPFRLKIRNICGDETVWVI